MALRCATIGECMLELSASAESVLGSYKLGFGGDTLNTAVYMARLGADVDFVTALGDDGWSDAMVNAWQGEGVGTDLIVRAEGRMPGLYAIKTNDDGERSFSYWRNESPARQLFELTDSDQLFNRLMKFDYLYLSGISLSLYSESARQRLWFFLSRYRAQSGVVAFDTNYRPRNWSSPELARTCFDEMARHCDILLPTLEDEQLFNPNLTLEQCARHYQQLGVDELIIKEGPKGCTVIDNGAWLNVPTVAVQAIDTTAAGDSFNAAYLTSRMQGQSPAVSAARAHICAAAVIQHPGAIIRKVSMPSALMEG
jgi:2-dehydro-3-deoxygluconokinase